MSISKDAPLVLSATNGAGKGTIHSKFTAIAPTLVWNSDPVEVNEVQVSIQGKDSVLSLAEVKVFTGNSHAVIGCGLGGDCMHGKCVNGQCICQPDYIGQTCDTYLLTAWRYTPPVLKPTRNFWSSGSKMEKKLLRQIHDLQFPKSNDGCGEKSAVGHVAGSGLGSVLMQMSGLLTTALAQGTTYVPSHPELHFWFDGNRFCGNHRRLDQCYVTPWTSCNKPPDPQRIRFSTNAFSGTFSAEAVPDPYTGKGSFWYRMVQIHFLIGNLSSKLRDKLSLEKLKQDIGFSHPIIGLHIRHGDSCPGTPGAFTARSCKGVNHYIQEVETMSKLYGIKSVFLATDDQKVVSRLRGHFKGRLNIVTTDIDRAHLEDYVIYTGWRVHSKNKVDTRLHGEDPDPQLEAALLDMLLLSQTDALIGTFNSNMFRLAFLLQVWNNRGFGPYVSRDGPWCGHWRMCCAGHDDKLQTTC
jgi:hypothetical protein